MTIGWDLLACKRLTAEQKLAIMYFVEKPKIDRKGFERTLGLPQGRCSEIIFQLVSHGLIDENCITAGYVKFNKSKFEEYLSGKI